MFPVVLEVRYGFAVSSFGSHAFEKLKRKMRREPGNKKLGANNKECFREQGWEKMVHVKLQPPLLAPSTATAQIGNDTLQNRTGDRGAL